MEDLRAGAAKACITPPENMMPGKSFMPFDFGAVYRDLYVRALVLDNGANRIAMIAYDAADMGRSADLRKALGDAYGFAGKELLFAATHTHEAPLFASDHEALAADTKKLGWVLKYGDFVIRQTVAAVGQALSKLRAARFGFGAGNSHINVCRDQLFEDGCWGQGADFEGPSDKTLAVLKIVDADGGIIAAMLNYAVHGTSCFMKMDRERSNYLISGDIPGMVSAYLEERYKKDGAVFLWTSGAAANQNPIFFCGYMKHNHDKTHGLGFDMGYGAWELCEHAAETQAIDAIRIMEQIAGLKRHMHIAIVERSVALPGQNIVRKDIRGGGDAIFPAANPADIEIQDAEPVELKLKLAVLDDIAFLGMNAELVSEIGMRLKEKAPLKNLVIVTHAGERIGYLPDRLGYDRRTFAFYASRVKGGCAEDLMTPVVMDMFDARFRE